MFKYIVLQHPTLGYEVVKEGFSFPAFFFGIFWMAYKKMWPYVMGGFVTLSIAVSLETILRDLVGFLPDLIVDSLKYGVAGMFGAAGNTWLAMSLEAKGYARVWAGEASTPVAAIEKSKVSEGQGQLPGYIDCPHCNSELELDETEQVAGVLSCPECGKTIDAVVLTSKVGAETA